MYICSGFIQTYKVLNVGCNPKGKLGSWAELTDIAGPGEAICLWTFLPLEADLRWLPVRGCQGGKTFSVPAQVENMGTRELNIQS